jgi:hypothetical protein
VKRGGASTWLTVIVGFGIIIRVRQYAANTSLWHDESFVVLNFLHRPFAALLGPLDWNEPSPPGFLAVEKVIAAALGHSEFALRLLPLLAGLAVLPAFVVFVRRFSDDAVVVWASLFVALSPKLIEHSSEVKHFTLDVLAALALLSLAWRVHETSPSSRRIWTWALTASVAPWFAYSSVFVFAATSMILTVPALTLWSAAQRRIFLLAHLVVLLSLALLAGPALQQRTPAVVSFWDHTFPDIAHPGLTFTWLARGWIALCGHFWQPLGALIIVCVVLATLAAWAERQRTRLAFLWLPILLTMLAGLLRLWPFGGNQHMAFVAPLVLLLAAHGAEIIRASLAQWHPRITIAFTAALLLPALGDACYHLIVPRYRHELRPVIRFMQTHASADDAVIVFDPATFAYYTGRDVRGDRVNTAAPSRLWVITPRSSRGALEPDVQRVLTALRQQRPQLDAKETPGAAGYLFGPPARDS